jgi:cell wall-associated NlpC family hydrolase
MRFRSFLIIAPLFVLFLPGAAVAQTPSTDPAGSIAVVTVPLANVRREPFPKSPIETQVLLAETVRVLERREERIRVSIPDRGGIEGWINAAALRIFRDRGDIYFAPGREWVVVSSPKTRARIVDGMGDQALSLYAGTRLPVLERGEKGWQVQLPDRRTPAVLAAKDVQPVGKRNPLVAAATPAEIAETARKFIGVQYFAGGVTEQGMDTRGLISTVYRIHGIDIDPDKLSSRKAGEQLSRKDLQPGDVLVFQGEDLGLYVGDGRFLYAPSRSRVQMNSLGDRRFTNSFRYGVRLLGPEHRTRTAEMTADEIMTMQGYAADLPIGRRIAYWAGTFIGTPYDTDPLGLYVRTDHIVADEAVDCMYLTFRAVELAKSATPGEAIEQALHRRFFTEGKLVDGLVRNYAERFEYGEDMVFSGKWGRNITDELGTTATIPGSRGRNEVIILPKSTLATKRLQQQLRDGDIIYWVKDPKKRVVEEIVAHLAFIHVRDGRPYLIHASGSKNKWSTPDGGRVKEVPFDEYLRESKFIGAFVTRFDE